MAVWHKPSWDHRAKGDDEWVWRRGVVVAKDADRRIARASTATYDTNRLIFNGESTFSGPPVARQRLRPAT